MAYTPKKSPQPASSNKFNGSGDKRLIKKESSNDLLNTPIKFNDVEVKRMHAELEKREKASKSNSPRNSNISKVSSTTRTTKKKNSTSSAITLKSFLLRVAIFYFLIAFYIVCPRDINNSRSICKNLNSLQKTIKSYDYLYLEPIVNPIINQVHSKLDPYYQEVQLKITPYIEQVKPYYNQASTFLTPHLENSIHYFNNQIQPKFFELLELIRTRSKPVVAEIYSQYQSTLSPTIEWYTTFIKEWYNQNVQRHYILVQSTVQTYYNQVYEYISPLYYEGLPILQKHYKETIKPITIKSYKISKTFYVEQVHPRILITGNHTLNFYKSTILPNLNRFWSLYISPQVDEIRGKIYEYRTKKFEKVVEKEVEVLKEVLKQEIEVDDLDEFIAELRVEEPVESEPIVEATAAPVIPEEVLPTPEELLALTAAKRQTLETLQTTYEKSIAKLGQVEHDLLVKRLSELRTNSVLDIPKRFNSLIEDLDGEGDKMVGRLQKYFSRVIEDENLSIEEKVNDADFLAKKALAKVNKLKEEILVEVENYKINLEGKESEAVTKASEALSDLVAKAQEELGFGWTWLDDVRHSDWARYHKLSKAQSTWSEYHSGVASGSIKDEDLEKIPNPITLLNDIKSQINSLVESFETILSKITIKGQKELKGEESIVGGVINNVEKVIEVVGDKVVEVVEIVKESASSILDLPTPTPSTIPETLSSIVEVAQESIVSVAQVVYEAIPEVPILNSASSNLEEVLSSGETTISTSSSVEVVESISSVIESVTSIIINDLPSSIASVYSVVEEVATSAVEQIIPTTSSTMIEEAESTPTNIIESISSVVVEVTEVVSSIIESITTTSSATASQPTDEGFASSVSSVAESIHSNAASIIEEVKEKLNVVHHEEL